MCGLFVAVVTQNIYLLNFLIFKNHSIVIFLNYEHVWFVLYYNIRYLPLVLDICFYAIAEHFSCGGNILINIGPAHDGTIATIYLERLKQLGQWLDVNGEAIYSSIPWTYQKDNRNDDVW